MQNQQGVFPAPIDYRLVAALVRARKIRFKPKKLGLHNQPRRAVDCAPYLTLYASAMKDWSRSFWSAVLRHRSCFGWRDDFHVGQGLVQTGPRWAVGLDEASPSNAGFTVPLDGRMPSKLHSCGVDPAGAGFFIRGCHGASSQTKGWPLTRKRLSAKFRKLFSF